MLPVTRGSPVGSCPPVFVGISESCLSGVAGDSRLGVVLQGNALSDALFAAF